MTPTSDSLIRCLLTTSNVAIHARHSNIPQFLDFLFNTKKELVKGILKLKSAFSVIDQMFQQEIDNHEIIKHNWVRTMFGCRSTLKTVDPRGMNKFIQSLTDPFSEFGI